MLLAAWLHNISPFAIRFTHDFGLRWYGLSYAAAFLIGWAMLRWLARRGAVLIPVDRVGDAILYAVAGVVVGGRLGYVLFYEPRLLTTFSGHPPWWGLLAINQGGMSSHGGMAGVILASFLIARGFKGPDGIRRGRAPVLHVLDALAIITPPGLMLGRIANFINGELLGREYAAPGQPAPWWTVKFPQELLVGSHGLPARSPGELSAIESVMRAAGISSATFEGGRDALVEKIQHGNQLLAGQIAPLLYARYPSQFFQAAAEGLVLGLFLFFLARRRRLPGIVGAWFMIGYGVLRIITEQFWRLPDSQFANPRPYGLSRGQWLSVAMLAVGVVGLVIVLRRGGQKLGGWGVRPQDGDPAGR
jgi:phosphatidylglycerol---prolipoprotein diacylglyceryl transferase